MSNFWLQYESEGIDESVRAIGQHGKNGVYFNEENRDDGRDDVSPCEEELPYYEEESENPYKQGSNGPYFYLSPEEILEIESADVINYGNIVMGSGSNNSIMLCHVDDSVEFEYKFNGDKVSFEIIQNKKEILGLAIQYFNEDDMVDFMLENMFNNWIVTGEEEEAVTTWLYSHLKITND